MSAILVGVNIPAGGAAPHQFFNKYLTFFTRLGDYNDALDFPV